MKYIIFMELELDHEPGNPNHFGAVIHRVLTTQDCWSGLDGRPFIKETRVIHEGPVKDA